MARETGHKNYFYRIGANVENAFPLSHDKRSKMLRKIINRLQAVGKRARRKDSSGNIMLVRFGDENNVIRKRRRIRIIKPLHGVAAERDQPIRILFRFHAFLRNFHFKIFRKLNYAAENGVVAAFKSLCSRKNLSSFISSIGSDFKILYEE